MSAHNVLIGRLMKLPALERFRGEERRFLDQQTAVPWRFSFSEVLEAPEEEFFRMRGILTRKGYLGEDHFGDNTFLVRTPSGMPGRREWSDRFEPFDPEKGTSSYRMSYHRDYCSRLSKLSVSPVTLQADLVMVPSPVAGNAGKGVFPFVLLLVDELPRVDEAADSLIGDHSLQV